MTPIDVSCLERVTESGMMVPSVRFVVYFPKYSPIASLIVFVASISLPFPSTLVETLTVKLPIPARCCIQILVFPPFSYVYGVCPHSWAQHDMEPYVDNLCAFPVPTSLSLPQ